MVRLCKQEVMKELLTSSEVFLSQSLEPIECLQAELVKNFLFTESGGGILRMKVRVRSSTRKATQLSAPQSQRLLATGAAIPSH